MDQGIRKGYEKSAKTVARSAAALFDKRAGAGTGGFLMLPAEAQDIAEPASRLLARHTPETVGAGRVTDLSDIVELVVSVFSYLMNGLDRRAAVFTVAGVDLAAPAPDWPAAEENAELAAQTGPPAALPSWPSPQRSPIVGGGG